MVRYIIRRLISGIVVLFLFVTVMYFAAESLLPGDYVSQFSLFLSPEEAAEARDQLGLDLPLWERYLGWLRNVLQGNLGHSFTAFGGQGAPVSEILKARLPSTLLVFGIGLVFAFLLGYWLGKTAAWKGPGIFSGVTTFSAIVLYTSFPPWLVFLLGFVILKTMMRPTIPGARLRGVADAFAAGVKWQMIFSLIFVVAILVALDVYLQKRKRKSIPILLLIIIVIAGWVGSWYILGINELAIELMREAYLPILIFTMLTFGEIMLIMRTTMEDTLHEDYVQTAHAKGLPDRLVRDRHAARNAILPTISRLVISLPYLLTGLAMIEAVVGWPGVGTTLFYALGTQNAPVIMGMILMIGLISLGVRITLDVLQASLDPRIRSGSKVSGRYL